MNPRKADRIAAAQARDAAIIEQAKRDPFLADWMTQSRTLDPKGFAKACAMARQTAQRPSSPDYQRALVALGGMAALESAPTT